MGKEGLQGAVRGKKHRTTVCDPQTSRPADLVGRGFAAPAPNRLWLAGLTSVRTSAGFVSVAFVFDACSRFSVGRQATSRLLEPIRPRPTGTARERVLSSRRLRRRGSTQTTESPLNPRRFSCRHRADGHVNTIRGRRTHMPKSQQSKPRLVAVAEIPKSTRRSIYVDLVDEFAKGNLQHARIEGVKMSAALSVKKAIATLELNNVAVVTVNGEVYLTKK
jgi:hypothetical protein